MATLDELMVDYERERIADIERADARSNSAQAKDKRKAEIQREIQLGMRDADGNWVFNVVDIEEEDDED